MVSKACPHTGSILKFLLVCKALYQSGSIASYHYMYVTTELKSSYVKHPFENLEFNTGYYTH